MSAEFIAGGMAALSGAGALWILIEFFRRRMWRDEPVTSEDGVHGDLPTVPGDHLK